jgi:hypothetical protein
LEDRLDVVVVLDRVVGSEALTGEEGLARFGDLDDQGFYVLGARGRRAEREVALLRANVDPIEREDVKMEVQVQRGAEPLEHCDRDAAPVGLFRLGPDRTAR